MNEPPRRAATVTHAVPGRKTMPALPDPTTHTVGAIFAAYERDAERDERTYLGASVIGDECEFKLFLAFRWAVEPETFDGRKLRLFETGHREEGRLIQDLRRAGIDVWEIDPDTLQQWGVTAIGGHFRGHLDGIVARVPEAPSQRHVLECKSHNEKSFKDLVSKGVEASKPTHYAQMQTYMHLTGIQRALYLAVNKNTDEIYAERVAYDPAKAGAIIAKAERIILTDRAPARLDAKDYRCGFCNAANVCRNGAFARRNCRTCLHASPVEGGWQCEKHGTFLDVGAQRAGCGDHRYLPDLVPGEQIDVQGTSIVYRTRTGTWIDGGAS
jgi:hypothetical protein